MSRERAIATFIAVLVAVPIVVSLVRHSHLECAGGSPEGMCAPVPEGPFPPSISTSEIYAKDAAVARYRGRRHDLAHISALRRLPPLGAHEVAALRGRFADLAVGGARVRPATAREPADGVVLAVRTDGYPCLLAEGLSSCYRGLGPSGVVLERFVTRAPDASNTSSLTMVGVAADDIANVDVVLTTGDTVHLPVRNNVFEATLRSAKGIGIAAYRARGIPWDP